MTKIGSSEHGSIPRSSIEIRRKRSGLGRPTILRRVMDAAKSSVYRPPTEDEERLRQPGHVLILYDPAYQNDDFPYRPQLNQSLIESELQQIGYSLSDLEITTIRLIPRSGRGRRDKHIYGEAGIYPNKRIITLYTDPLFKKSQGIADEHASTQKINELGAGTFIHEERHTREKPLALYLDIFSRIAVSGGVLGFGIFNFINSIVNEAARGELNGPTISSTIILEALATLTLLIGANQLRYGLSPMEIRARRAAKRRLKANPSLYHNFITLEKRGNQR